MLRQFKPSLQFILLLALLMHTACRNKKGETVVIKPVPPASAVKEDKPANPVIVNKEIIASYEKTACFGTCPIFRFELYNDGTALYHGVNFVNMIGDYEAEISESSRTAVLREAEAIHFSDMKDLYDEPHVTDLPSVITGVRTKDQLKVVTSRRGGPNELKSLYAVFDEIIKNAQWTLKTEKENKH